MEIQAAQDGQDKVSVELAQWSATDADTKTQWDYLEHEAMFQSDNAQVALETVTATRVSAEWARGSRCECVCLGAAGRRLQESMEEAESMTMADEHGRFPY